MVQKGLIMGIENDYMIVMTDDHKYMRIKRKENCIIGHRIFFTEDDLVKKRRSWKESLIFSKKVFAVATALVMIIALGGVWGFNGIFNSPADISIATVMTIDINPSVKVSLDENDIVVEIQAMNEDAKTLNFNGIIGMKAEDAVEKIVELAKTAGFINPDDLKEDYVLITTVSMNDEDHDKTETLKTKIEEKIASSEDLQEVNVAIIKATKVEMREAEGKKVPVGLYVVNGAVEINGERMTVKEYFTSIENIEEFENEGEIIGKKLEKKIELANKFIEKLQNANVDVTALKASLASPTVDIDALLKEIKALWETVDIDDESEEDDDESEDATEIDADEDKDESEEATEDDDDDSDKDKDKASEKALDKAKKDAEKDAEKDQKKLEKELDKQNKQDDEAEDDEDEDDEDEDEDDEDDQPDSND